MYNPLEEKVPGNLIERVHALARDLAYGVIMEKWPPEISVSRSAAGEQWMIFSKDRAVADMLEKKWVDKYPPARMLLILDYLTLLDHRAHEDRYLPTSKAFALLERSVPASIFISYRHSQSSLLALLVLARLKAIDLNPFFDIQNIGPGDKWHAMLKEQIEQSDHLICILAPETLESEWVRKEITWAIERNCLLIPIWHEGFGEAQLQQAIKDYPELRPLEEANAIAIAGNTVEDYNNAMVKLVNVFGITPT